MNNKNSYELTKPAEKSEEEESEQKFGYFGFTPSWLQWLNTSWGFLAGVSGLTFGQAHDVKSMMACMLVFWQILKNSLDIKALN